MSADGKGQKCVLGDKTQVQVQTELKIQSEM